MDNISPCDNCGEIRKLTTHKSFNVCFPCWLALSEDDGGVSLDHVDYEYIPFVKQADKPKTSVWKCVSKSHGDVLGLVKWYGSWRQYCFFPVGSTVFNIGCMADISDFIQKAEAARK